ncbi:MAG TPA: hypothetical protein VHB21_07305, partial [Minicystis sp.]|nr:hypothetical protein [Minicystis sp.]
TVYLAHALVAPSFRRHGLGAALRDLARRDGDGARQALGEDADLLLAAEMEPYDAAAPDSIGRLVAYGKDGFGVLDPSVVLYQQPDFRELGAADVARPIPLLAVVRWCGHEAERLLPRRLAEAYVRHLHAVFATHCRATDLAPLAAISLEAIGRAPDPLPLLRLPTSADDEEALAPLAKRDVLRLYATN